MVTARPARIRRDSRGRRLPPPPQRRTQKERSRATRLALMKAACEVIGEIGYAGATTAEIARRAGVSRGAQVHHYATKQQLVLAAADHVLSGVETEIEGIARRLRQSERGTEVFIFDLWERVFSPANFQTIMELVAAARTDPVLKEMLSARWVRLIQAYDAIWSRVPKHPGAPSSDMETALALTLSLMRGLAFERIIRDNEPEYYRQLLKSWSGVVRHLMGRDGMAEGGRIARP